MFIASDSNIVYVFLEWPSYIHNQKLVPIKWLSIWRNLSLSLSLSEIDGPTFNWKYFILHFVNHNGM